MRDSWLRKLYLMGWPNHEGVGIWESVGICAVVFQGWGEYYSGTRLAQNGKQEYTKNTVLEYWFSSTRTCMFSTRPSPGLLSPFSAWLEDFFAPPNYLTMSTILFRSCSCCWVLFWKPPIFSMPRPIIDQIYHFNESLSMLGRESRIASGE